MTSRKRIALETLLLLALLLAFGFFFKDEVAALLKRFVVSMTAVEKDDHVEEESLFFASKPVFNIPLVRLEEKDREIPNEWNPDVLKKLNYARLEEDPAPVPHSGMTNGTNRLQTTFAEMKYDVLLDTTEKQIKYFVQYSSKNPSQTVKRAAGFRHALRVRALALELNGNLDEALYTYGALYPASSESFQWSLYRNSFERLQGREDRDSIFLNFSVDFVNLCAFVAESDVAKSIDETLKKLEEIQGMDASEIERLGDVPYPADDPYYPVVLRAYRFRNECAKFANPRLQVSLPIPLGSTRLRALPKPLEPYRNMTSENSLNARKELVFLTRKSYAIFLSSMEEFCEWRNRQIEIQRQKAAEGVKVVDSVPTADPPDIVDQTMELFRKLGELPY